MAAKIAQGGPVAAQALDLTLGRLRAIEDPVKRDAAAVALFGTQAEDLGDSLYALDPSQAVASLGNFADATQVAGDRSVTAQERLTAWQRTIIGTATSALDALGPLGTLGAALGAYGPAAMSTLAPLGMMISAQRAASAAAVASGARQRASLLSTVGGWVAAGTASLAHGAVVVAQWVRMATVAMVNAARMAAAWLIALGPIGWVIAAVVGVVALIIANWDRVKEWTKAAWAAVSGFVSRAWERIKAAVVQGTQDMIGFVRSIPGRILSALGDLGGLLVNAGRSIISGLWSGIKAMGTWLKNKILDFIRSFVPGPVLRFLGISSPSRLFADIGAEIPAGLAAGILSGARSVAAAAEGMAAAAAQPAVPRLPGAGRVYRTEGTAADRLADTAGLRAALRSAVFDALDGAQLRVDGRGVAQLVRGENRLLHRRGATPP